MNYIISKVSGISNNNLYTLVLLCLILVLPTAVLITACLITTMLAIKLNTIAVFPIPVVVGICIALWNGYIVAKLNLTI